MAYSWDQGVNKIDNTQPQVGQQGWGLQAQAARNKGYQGPFTVGQNYADPQGQNFTQATHILQGGFSGQSDPTTQYQDALRSAAMGRIGSLQDNAAQRKQSMTADLEQGFTNQANMLRRSAAGTGAGASLGYGRASGDLANQFQQNLSKGLLGVDNQTTSELGQLGGIGQGLFSQELQNRQQQYNQSQDLANMYQNFGNVEGGREQQAAAQSMAETQARQAAQAKLISGIMSGVGAAAGSYGGPAGASAGGQLGSLYPQPAQPNQNQQNWRAASNFFGGMGGAY